MKIAVRSSLLQYEELKARGVPEGVELFYCTDKKSPVLANAYFDLLFEEEGASFGEIMDTPVFVSSVTETYAGLASNFIRINAWAGFFSGPSIELVPRDNSYWNVAEDILTHLGWKYQTAPDTPGMLSAGVVAMIINEAYFALGEGISTKEEIDIAMKTGTNYPHGPFEWSEKIGLKKVHALLEKLSTQNHRYTIAPQLIKTINFKP